MKIAHVVDSMEVGGAETLVAQMCRLQREQGHDPSVYAIAKLGALGEQMRLEGFLVQANVGRHFFDSAVGFYRIFKNLHPDVVHLHNPTPTIYASAAAKLAGAGKIISTRHSLVAPPHNQVMELKYAWAASFCDWVVGICDATTNNLKELRKTAERKIIRIYNGALAIQRIADQRGRLQETDFTLLYVGRLEPVKNHDLLLTAFRAALVSEPRLRLWIVGDGTQRSRLEQIATSFNITDRVTFWGQQLDVARFFSAANVFVMSSSSEGLPMSLLQAFSAGLPAIVTDVGGMAEVVRIADGGIVVPLGNAQGMTAAILQLVQDPAQRQRYAGNAQEAFTTNFSLERMADAYMRLYRGDNS